MYACECVAQQRNGDDGDYGATMATTATTVATPSADVSQTNMKLT